MRIKTVAIIICQYTLYYKTSQTLLKTIPGLFRNVLVVMTLFVIKKRISFNCFDKYINVHTAVNWLSKLIVVWSDTYAIYDTTDFTFDTLKLLQIMPSFILSGIMHINPCASISHP